MRIRSILDALVAVWENMGRLFSAAPFDPPRYPRSSRDALRKNWEAVGDDLRVAMGRKPRFRRDVRWPSHY